MTNKPTDAEIIALADETRTGEPGREGYILPISFARAVLARWGAQDVPASQGYALVPVEPSAEMVDAAQEAYMPFGDMQIAIQLAIAAAPQPVAREPLTDEQIKDLQDDGVFLGACRQIVRAIEAAHGIKGGKPCA